MICELILFSDQIVGRPNDCTVFSAETAQIEQQWIDRSVACLSRGLVRYRELVVAGLSARLPSPLLSRINFKSSVPRCIAYHANLNENNLAYSAFRSASGVLNAAKQLLDHVYIL